MSSSTGDAAMVPVPYELIVRGSTAAPVLG